MAVSLLQKFYSYRTYKKLENDAACRQHLQNSFR